MITVEFRPATATRAVVGVPATVVAVVCTATVELLLPQAVAASASSATARAASGRLATGEGIDFSFESLGCGID
jgi:hypothetical protein